MVAFGFVWAERRFLVNDHINVMIPLSVSGSSFRSLPSLSALFLFPTTACDSASDPCRCEGAPPPHPTPRRGLSNCYHILSSAACYFSQRLGTHINTHWRLLNVKGHWAADWFWPLFRWCQNVICCHITAILKSYFPRQWKYELSLWEESETRITPELRLMGILGSLPETMKIFFLDTFKIEKGMSQTA